MAGDVLNIRPADECLRDCAAFGEVMLRFDPGHGRLRNARTNARTAKRSPPCTPTG